jgi:hypothetical protein
MKKFVLLLAFVLPIAFAFTSTTDHCTTCDTPDNVRKTAETSTTISFAWNGVDAADEYILRWVRQSDSATSGDVTVSGTTHTFTNMTAGTYNFYFSSKCGLVTSTAFIVIDDVSGF